LFSAKDKVMEFVDCGDWSCNCNVTLITSSDKLDMIVLYIKSCGIL